jgi:hypothetical protein
LVTTMRSPGVGAFRPCADEILFSLMGGGQLTSLPQDHRHYLERKGYSNGYS